MNFTNNNNGVTSVEPHSFTLDQIPVLAYSYSKFNLHSTFIILESNETWWEIFLRFFYLFDLFCRSYDINKFQMLEYNIAKYLSF